MTSDDALPSLVARAWVAQGVRWDEGASEQAIEAIERAHDIALPAALRALWRLSDGTTAPDAHGLVFYQASDLVQPLYASREGDQVVLLFADWRQGTATFALVLAPCDAGVVLLRGRAPAEPHSPSFDAFLARWLQDGPLVP